MKYEAGTKKAAIEELIRCAIQDRNSLIDCHLVHNAITDEMEPASNDSIETILDCEKAIRDFEKLAKTLR